MTNSIAQASIASTNLLNGLQLVNRENERVSENAEVFRRFETCKNLRRQILHYIQHVESDEWIGSLVNANDELVRALTAYEIMDRSISDDFARCVRAVEDNDAALLRRSARCRLLRFAVRGARSRCRAECVGDRPLLASRDIDGQRGRCRAVAAGRFLERHRLLRERHRLERARAWRAADG